MKEEINMRKIEDTRSVPHKKQQDIDPDTLLSSQSKNNFPQKRWVLLEKLPPLLTPRVLMLVFVYSIAFTLLLVGLKLFRLEQNIQNNKAKALLSEKPLPSEEPAAAEAFIYPVESTENIQKNIAKNIIRLHVIANSDSPEDQSLKLAVRDKIISSLQDTLAEADSVEEAHKLLEQSSDAIKEAASQVVQDWEKEEDVQVSLCSRYFPVKQYGDLTFPAGDYQALCVEIGAAEGRNWWCVLFPSLCFLDETTATVPEESKDRLQENLSAEEYNSLEKPQTVGGNIQEAGTAQEEDGTEKPQLHSALWDWFFR